MSFEELSLVTDGQENSPEGIPEEVRMVYAIDRFLMQIREDYQNYDEHLADLDTHVESELITEEEKTSVEEFMTMVDGLVEAYGTHIGSIDGLESRFDDLSEEDVAAIQAVNEIFVPVSEGYNSFKMVMRKIAVFDIPTATDGSIDDADAAPDDFETVESLITGGEDLEEGAPVTVHLDSSDVLNVRNESAADISDVRHGDHLELTGNVMVMDVSGQKNYVEVKRPGGEVLGYVWAEKLEVGEVEVERRSSAAASSGPFEASSEGGDEPEAAEAPSSRERIDQLRSGENIRLTQSVFDQRMSLTNDVPSNLPRRRAEFTSNVTVPGGTIIFLGRGTDLTGTMSHGSLSSNIAGNLYSGPSRGSARLNNVVESTGFTTRRLTRDCYWIVPGSVTVAPGLILEGKFFHFNRLS